MAESEVQGSGHPLLLAVTPLVERMGARLVSAADLTADDVPLVWDGTTVAGVRLGPAPSPSPAAAGDLGGMLSELAVEMGGALAGLPRADKQRAVRLLEERGAFAYRKSAETVAEALGVTRFTVYNYLNRRD